MFKPQVALSTYDYACTLMHHPITSNLIMNAEVKKIIKKHELSSYYTSVEVMYVC